MSDIEPRSTLLARLDMLERHAVALRDAFTGVDLKEDAERVIGLLREARASIGAAATPGDVADAERTIRRVTALLAALGRAS
jgi:hypothetical protein